MTDERIFKDDFVGRMKIFDSLVIGVMVYDVEVWGWTEIGDLQRIHRRSI